jgi:tRNA pseudouridine32 synthase/23S rRNA pseudouridine746 synthase
VTGLQSTPPQPPLRILIETGRFVVIDKPPGVRSVPGLGETGEVCMVNAVRAAFPQATGPLSVHRLDMPTSGIMVFALDPEAHRGLSWQFESRTVSKRYTALLAGDLARQAGATEGEVTLPIRPDYDNRPTQIVDFVHGRSARTIWQAVGPEDLDGRPVTRVIFTPVTGRSHQLRVHAASPAPGGLGAPIVGDPLYGGPEAARLMLHASTLEFDDPDTGERVVVQSAAPF